MTGTGRHRGPDSNSTVAYGSFLAMGVLLSISLSLNAVLYVILTWNLVPN